jgi:hypothetical protein
MAGSPLVVVLQLREPGQSHRAVDVEDQDLAGGDADTVLPDRSVVVGRSTSSTPSGGREVIVMFTARRLKPGAWEQFRRAWDPGDDIPAGFQRAYHARNIRDEDEIISFGLFDMDVAGYHRWRADADAAETQRVDRLSAFVENEHVSGVFEVIDVVEE